ncbi:uncharacterized protein [Coffea arabica]|uniref:Uncharacterized protein n=1 Tax=Coffea arabica TaxID=13443 RepID=A0ABM4X0R1_COFAR
MMLLKQGTGWRIRLYIPTKAWLGLFTSFALSKFQSITQDCKKGTTEARHPWHQSASIPRSRTSQCFTKKQSPGGTRIKRASSLGAQQETHTITSNSEEGHKRITLTQTGNYPLVLTPVLKRAKDGKQPTEADSSAPKFFDKRWKNGTWDLNMFVKRGKMDWHAVIFAGQTGSVACKAALFITVIGVVFFRRKEDLQRLAEEATFSDKQWQASWQDQNDRSGASD